MRFSSSWMRVAQQLHLIAEIDDRQMLGAVARRPVGQTRAVFQILLAQLGDDVVVQRIGDRRRLAVGGIGVLLVRMC